MKTLVTPMAEDVVSLDMLRSHCRIDGDMHEEDLLLGLYGRAAASLAEHELERPLLPQQWRFECDLPAVRIRLHTDVLSVAELQVCDTAGVWSDLSPSQWLLKGGCYLMLQGVSGVAVRGLYRCGAWAEAKAIPSPISQWIMLRVATAYANREAVVLSGREQLAALPRSFIDGLLDPYRWGG